MSAADAAGESPPRMEPDGRQRRARRPASTHDPATRVLLALRRILHAAEQHSATLQRSIGLTSSQLAVLRELAATRESTAATLARALSVSAPTMTGILNRLELRGLIERRRSDVDRRQTPVSLTPTARRLLRAAPPVLPAGLHASLGERSESGRRRLVGELERIAELMETGG